MTPSADLLRFKSLSASQQCYPSATPTAFATPTGIFSNPYLVDFVGADGGTRTLTTLPSQDFKSCVSTDSTTSACGAPRRGGGRPLCP